MIPGNKDRPNETNYLGKQTVTKIYRAQSTARGAAWTKQIEGGERKKVAHLEGRGAEDNYTTRQLCGHAQGATAGRVGKGDRG